MAEKESAEKATHYIRRRTRRRRWLAILGGVVGFLLLVGYFDSDGLGEPLHVILITLDTTRTDALGIYGGELARTPHLDELGRQSLVFTHAITTTPYTGAAHASILTGLYPPQHGLRDYMTQRLRESVRLLPEVMADGGYATAAFVSSFVLDERYGFAQGFEVYSGDFWKAPLDGSNVVPPKGARVQRRAEETVREAMGWLETRSSRQPFFLWLHLFDPHMPYNPPLPFLGVQARARGLSRAERLRHRYYDETSYMDSEIGKLLDYLADRKMLERSIIAVVADHGELLGEHGRALGSHAQSLFEATIRVPMMLRIPNGPPPGVVAEPVRTIDLFPTLLEAVGLPIPEECEGRSLLKLALGQDEQPRSAYSETLDEFFPERADDGKEFVSFQLAGWKLVSSPLQDRLYDLNTDPDELFDVSVEFPDRVAALKRELRGLAERWPSTPVTQRLELSEEELREDRERLRALGYVE